MNFDYKMIKSTIGLYWFLCVCVSVSENCATRRCWNCSQNFSVEQSPNQKDRRKWDVAHKMNGNLNPIWTHLWVTSDVCDVGSVFFSLVFVWRLSNRCRFRHQHSLSLKFSVVDASNALLYASNFSPLIKQRKKNWNLIFFLFLFLCTNETHFTNHQNFFSMSVQSPVCYYINSTQLWHITFETEWWWWWW